MPKPIIASPASYAALSCLAVGREGMPALPVDQNHPLPVAMAIARRPSFRSGAIGFVPVATPTDIACLRANNYGRSMYIESIAISGTATAASVLDVLIQRTPDGGGGTYAMQAAGKLDNRHASPTGAFYTFSVNRTSGGNGVSATRPLMAAGKLHLGTAATPVAPLTFRFDGPNRPVVRDLAEWLVINLNGQAVPAGCSLDIFVEWSEEPQPPLQFAGDSTTSNANVLFQEIGNSGLVAAAGNFNNSGSNGARLEDALLNLNSIIYPLVGGNGILARLNGMPGVLVFCYGLNDLRLGGKTRAELISMIDAAIHATLYGTTSGAIYTSPMGAGTAFTWPATIPANPDCQIVLWAPNSLTTDGNASNFVTLTGRFASGYTLAQAAQELTDDFYIAYEAFRDDPRIFRLVHKQDVFGRVSTPLAASGNFAQAAGLTKTNAPLMTDILHPNARGQTLSARQIVPHLRDAIAAAQSMIF